MTRRRDLVPCMSAFYAKRFPTRQEKTDFSDELLALADMLIAQIDPDGTKPLICPPMSAEGYEAQPSAKAKGRHGGSE